jgi:predicted DNA-binding transcriptional regulator AlpA
MILQNDRAEEASNRESHAMDSAKLLSEGDGTKPRRMLNEKQVLGIVPVGRSTLWRMEKAGKFPKAKHIATNRRIWFEDEVTAWQNELTN